jgi:hypothetical protein
VVREGRARGIEGASWHQENNLLRSVFIASDLLDILVPGLAGLFVQSVAIAVLPVAALAPPAQVAQLVHHDILQPCPARAPRRVPRLPRGRLARLQLILIKPTVCSLWSCSASQADTAGRQPRRAARRTRPGTRRRRPSRSLPGAPISRLSSQCASTVCEYPRLLSLLPAPLSLGSCPVRGSCGGKQSVSAQALAAPVSSTLLALIGLPI